MFSPLIARDISVSFSGRPVFAGLDVVAPPGRRIGIVGENGSGKSTLLHALAGTLPDVAVVDGSIEAPDDVMLLSQEPPFDEHATIGEVLETTLRPLREAVSNVERLAGRMHEPGVAEEYSAALEWAMTYEAWQADQRAGQAAATLGLAELSPQRRVGTLSGGQRTRLALTTIMTRRPEVVLLDEPTNHLDDNAIALLTTFLRDLPGVVVFASHDRVFLDEVATELVDVEPGAFGTDGHGGRRFGGGWSAYEHARRESRRRWEETYAAQQEELARLRAATRLGASAVAHNRGPTDNDKFIVKFRGARVDRAAARRKHRAQQRLEEAERTQVRKPPPVLGLTTPLTSSGGRGRVVHVRNMALATRVRVDQFDVDAGERVLVTGPNGAGKSTLLGVLSGRLCPTSGTAVVTARQVAELTQDPVFADPQRCPEQVYRDVLGEPAAERCPLPSLGLVPPKAATQPVGSLSVGQRRRLALALAVAQKPDVLLLDEPTNHISLALASELEAAMATSVGTVLVASHDRWLRQHWQGREFALTLVS